MLGFSGIDGHDPAFSRRLAAQGWLGITIPAELGGQGRGPVQRWVLTEELLAAQAPVSAHWFADRQSAPIIASHGTDEQRAQLLGPIIAGEAYYSIGMSEPDAGSDLAAVSTTAVRVEGGWCVNGTKVWTSLAQHNHWFIALCRTSQSESKHEGLSQLIVDLHAPGVTISPIPTLDGEQEFCEVALRDVFVPAGMLLGREGDGWAQVAGELAFERGGPDRYLSAWGPFKWLVEAGPVGAEETIGRLTARYRIVRELALAAARALERGGSPAIEAAVTKDLGTILEQDTIEAARSWLDLELDPTSSDPRRQTLARGVLTAPTFTLRGGTTEILRTLIAKSAAVPTRPDQDLVARTVARIVDDTCPPHVNRRLDGALSRPAWDALAEAGLLRVGIEEDIGGSGGTVRDAAAVLRVGAARAVPVPLAESGLVGGWLAATAGLALPEGPLGVALEHDLCLDGDLVTGRAFRVAWGRDCVAVLAVVDERLVAFAPSGIVPGRALCGEPRDNLDLDRVRLLAVAPAPLGADAARMRLAAARCVQMAGALRAALGLVGSHTRNREQFGQALIRFQAVGQQVAVVVEQVARAEMASELAIRWLEGRADDADLAAAVVTAREAATTGTRIAHQVHGAIGVAAEYDLQLLTRRLWTWRDDAGSERSWAVRLGTAAVAEGKDLWTWLSR
jgi:alkylation response protein AidB-like acyl-CoA dehydrogenase